MKISVRSLVMFGMLCLPALAFAQEPADLVPTGKALGEAMEGAITATGSEQVSTSVRLIVLFTTLSFIPGMLMLMTPFTRFVMVFSLLRQSLGLQQSPPNQVLVSLSLMLSLVVMQPTFKEVNDNALQPYLNSQIDTITFYNEAISPMRRFMLANTGRDELATSIRISRIPRPESLDELPTPVVVVAFVLSEIKTAMVTAVKVAIPFLVIDLVVSSSLLGMGMMMLPPVVVSLPFKLLVFVLMDGWDLLIIGLTSSVR